MNPKDIGVVLKEPHPTQFAVGAGLPIGLSSDATDIALFLYMSFEHRYKEVAE